MFRLTLHVDISVGDMLQIVEDVAVSGAELCPTYLVRKRRLFPPGILSF
jgi:hypothetical protein